MMLRSPFLFLFFLVFAPFIASGQLYRTTVGPPELREAGLELRNGLSVLTVALSPGDEDMELLADLTIRRGAKILSSYATNGEAGESDVSLGYPTQFAAQLRMEASKAMEAFKARVFFLNIPDIGAARDTGVVYKTWDRDSIEIQLMRLISLQRPHLVILFAERRYAHPSVQWELLKAHLLQAVQRLKPPTSVRELSRSEAISTWPVERVVAGSRLSGSNTRKPGARSEGARRQYVSLRQQLADNPRFSYTEIFPGKRPLRSVDGGLPHVDKTRLASLVPEMRKLADQISESPAMIKRGDALKAVTALTDSVDLLIANRYSTLSHTEQKMLLLWKDALQDIKNGLLRVSITYSLSEQILAPRQLTYLTIDSIRGTNLPADLWLYFPDVKNGWIINETTEQHIPLKEKTQYRLVSPGTVPFNLPASLDGLDKNDVITPVNLYVVGSARDRTTNVAVKLTLPIQFAPKFSAEPMTPVVRAIDGEHVVVRLTNHSRDGVRSQIEVNDSLVTSHKAGFRLHQKESVETDTLRLAWRRVPRGTYLAKITIEGIPVARFASRSFDVLVDSTRRIGLVTTFDGGATAETLRRLRTHYEQIGPRLISKEWLAAHEVVVLDRRLLSLDPTIASRLPELKQYVADGGHLIVLAQDAESWNAAALIEGIRLERSSAFESMSEVSVDSTDALLLSPNRIQPDDWTEWLWYRAYNRVSVMNGNVTTPMKDSATGSAFVVRALEGKGTITYVDLALPPQWLNIHGGAFRLFANLLSS